MLKLRIGGVRLRSMKNTAEAKQGEGKGRAGRAGRLGSASVVSAWVRGTKNTAEGLGGTEGKRKEGNIWQGHGQRELAQSGSGVCVVYAA
jgi:hypothetical protein